MEISEENITRNELFKNNIIHFLGTRVDNITKETALKFIKEYVKDNLTRKIFFTNVHTIQIARKDSKFRDIVNKADLCLPDGSGLKIAGKIFSTPIKENLNGTDLTPYLLDIARNEGWKVYLLGAQQDILIRCAAKIEETFPQIKITGMHSGFFNAEELPSIIQNINKSAPDILLVAMGSPLQEIFIDYASNYLNNTVCMAIGGLFDFISGDKKRAPIFIRKLGLEWVFRFFHDPKTKWNRIFIEIPNFMFWILVFRFFPQLKPNSIKNKLSYM